MISLLMVSRCPGVQKIFIAWKYAPMLSETPVSVLRGATNHLLRTVICGRRGDSSEIGDAKLMKFLSQELSEGHLRPTLKPEERLLLAVVESAYWDLQSPDALRRRTARHYFLDEQDDHAFSFVAICQHFSWSPGSIRSQLSALLNPNDTSSSAEIC
jgi:hypothetical protein